MKKNPKTKRQILGIILISLVLIPSMLGTILPNIIDSLSRLTNENEEYTSNELLNLKYSASSGQLWWDKSYSYRQIINVTNPYAVDLIDYAVNFTFDHGNLVGEGKMESDLGDLRIVENGILRKYYFKMDYPVINETTVWFNTNVSAGTNDDDTLLYYGKPGAQIDDEGHYFMNTATNDPADSFGWIRNGDFEFDNGSTAPDPTRIDGVFGWNWTDDVPYDMDSGYAPNSPPVANYQHNISVTNTQHEILKGDYTFKWGVKEHEVSTDTGADFIGTLYSFPFIVPEIAGAGSPKIYIRFWRNIRVYDKSRNNYVQYFARISNSYSQTMDSGYHLMIGDYIERWDSTGTNNNDREREIHIYGDSDPYPTAVNTAFLTNDLNDDIYFDVTPYQGDLIFVEFGMYGLEGAAVSSFGQIDSVSFNYILQTDLDPEIEQRKAEITVIARDVDGRIVPNAEVTLVNNTGVYTEIETYNTSSDEGSAVFPSVSFGDYNFTVNYTLPEGQEIVVYNSCAIVGFPGYEINTAIHEYDLPLDIWTIDFEMVDYDKEMLNYGYILVNDTLGGGELLANLTLDEYGKATFRGENQSEYYYHVFYDNDDYNLNPTALNESYIYRSTYEQNNKYQAQTLYIHQLNLNPYNDPVFNVSQRVYTNGSLTELVNNKIINAYINISLLDQGCDFTSVRIYYIDKDNSTEGNLIYENTTYIASDIEEIIDLDIRHPNITSANLKGDSYEVYGLLIELVGDNSSSTICYGEINVNFTETTNIYNETDLVKLNVKIVDTYDAGVTACYVNVNSSQGVAAGFNVDLKTDNTGYTFGQGNTNLPFWFLRGYQYNFTLTFLGDHVDLNVTESDQWPGHVGYYYNYTLLSQKNITLKLHFASGGVINLSDYQTEFIDLYIPDQVMWGENITVSVNFTKTDDDWVTTDPVLVATTINCTVRSTGIGAVTLFILDMVSGVGDGNFTVTFNSSWLSAGIRGGEVYSIIISGSKEGYIDPPDVSDTIYVEAIPTDLTMHDYDNVSIEINDVSETFGESINLTVKYYNNSNFPITTATVTYEWLSLEPIQFYQDPINLGYYTTALNTSIAQVWGIRTILFTATLENYTTATFLTSISITERPTLLNGTNNVIFDTMHVKALETEYLEFNYTDVLSTDPIANPDEMSYNWQKLDEDDEPIPGETRIGTLIETGDHRYILDLDTELMELGKYFVFISLHKLNYELRNAVISLTIEERPTSVNGSTGTIFIDMGDSSNFTYSYTDDLTNSSITNLDPQKYNYTSTSPTDPTGNGTLAYDSVNEVYYLLNFDTTIKQNGTYTITVTFEKENYTSQEVVCTLVIEYKITDYLTYLTLISQNPLNFTTDIEWRDNVTINFNFTTQYQSEDPELANPTSISLQFLDESLSTLGSSINLINYNYSLGEYSYTFNTSQLFLVGGESYYIRISASKTNYTLPTPLIKFFKLHSVLTELTIHNYTTGILLPSYIITEYWNQTIGLTFYFRELISTTPITDAVITYSWTYGSGQINPDGAKGSGYYSFFFDTSDANEVGTFIITILAVKQNFSDGVPSSNLVITIINRPTLLRPAGETDNYSVIFISDKIYALETEFYEFNYTDFFTSDFIKNADEATYYWQKLDDGDPIPGDYKMGILIEAADRYILDLDTEFMEVAEYFILITLNKLNYESRSIVFSFTIEDRITTVNGSIGGFAISLGQTLNFTYSYLDNLTSTSVTNLDIQSYTYNGTASGAGTLGYDPTNQIYYLDGFDTASLLDGTYTITVTFEKENYTSQVVVCSLVITYVEVDYKTNLTLISYDPLDLLTEIYWRDNITIVFNFTTQFQSALPELANPTTIRLQFLDESLDAIGVSINLINYNYSIGEYSYTFNTSHFSFIGGNSYYMSIYASKTTPYSYTPPTPLLIFFKVQSVLTDLTIHNYTTGIEFPSYSLTEYWNETLGITFYFGELISDAPITNAVLTYTWIHGSGQIYTNGTSGYYSFIFDTGDAPEVGNFIITILAVKQNFSDAVPNPSLIINIINRPTQLDSNEDVLYLPFTKDVLDSYNFTFEYVDDLTLGIIENADEKSFILHKREANGDIIPGSTIIGFLIESASHHYILDLNSETLQVGVYSIVVTLNKDNYDLRVAIISLTIVKREFTLLFSTDAIINIDSGENVQFQITITDLNNNSAPIIGVDLTLTIGGIEYSTITGGITDNNDGTYTVDTFTISEPFFTSETYIATLTIEKANYTSHTRDFTVVVKITEIFPGMPTFYFILIISSIIGVLGSVTAYRVIQQARIPKHVKKIRKIKKLIKSEKTITEAISIPTKAEMFAKLFKNDWKEIDLSIEETLGIEELKKKLPETTVELKKDKIEKKPLKEKKMKVPKEKKEKAPKEKKEKVPEEIVPEEIVPEEIVPEEIVPEEIVPEEIVPEEIVPEEIVPEEIVPEEIVPEEIVPEEIVPEEIVPEEIVPEEIVPEEIVPEEIVPEEIVPEETVPEEIVPEEIIPEEIIPEETVPEEKVPEEEIPKDETKEERGEDE